VHPTQNTQLWSVDIVLYRLHNIVIFSFKLQSYKLDILDIPYFFLAAVQRNINYFNFGHSRQEKAHKKHLKKVEDDENNPHSVLSHTQFVPYFAIVLHKSFPSHFSAACHTGTIYVSTMQ